ncbi:MAG: Rieske 2Fe-2S domain-containing protein [Acidobacteria bacterium]|nr:Rieske 2Fe-2S domain-containing protein [Acidobacteriota bacterium]MCI0625434.1 Rieske 2Fe-2S domain-containing protein [Acidobacteriota bacterium]MCI0717530.1 Rieske 2Fe-2S domain-containing protein [Acidobacteriota bacterium]
MPNSEGKGEKSFANVAVDQSPPAPVPPVKPDKTGKLPGFLSKFSGMFKRGEPVGTVPRRRRIVAACTLGFLGTNFFMFLRFFFPRTLFEPKTVFRIGYPADFGFGVDTKFQKDYRIWVVRNAEGIFVIYARCTHLGCTPDWKSGENKFKCPCHGSGYDTEGVNFEGPAPRPLDRAKVELDAEGQIVVDTSVLYDWPKGSRSRFKDPGAFLPL